MRRKISQREARRTVKQLRELQDKHYALLTRYGSTLPGVEIMQFSSLTDWVLGVLETASKVGLTLAAKFDVYEKKLKIYAVK